MKKVKNHRPLHSKFTCFHPLSSAPFSLRRTEERKSRKEAAPGEAAAEVGYNTEKSDKEKNSLSIQHGYPHHTICYAMNRLMAYINKKSSSGVLLYGPPSTGKTLRANAVAITLLHPSSQLLAQNLLRSTWERNVSRVRKWFVMFFNLQKDNSPAIIFIDEMDRFEHAFDVKVIMETKRADTLGT
ncbi:26S proteasome regulatory subunitB [Sesamum angolense]|uniref:26S proteasome regulatory subunitB n=1 Tax=Sesamum angolense TaxID=2727404 RepID=A0AAE1VU88_9LAMI|nr:26S proteasome regulatory subunitB [Sesamum angolense]